MLQLDLEAGHLLRVQSAIQHCRLHVHKSPPSHVFISTAFFINEVVGCIIRRVGAALYACDCRQAGRWALLPSSHGSHLVSRGHVAAMVLEAVVANSRSCQVIVLHWGQ